VSNIKMMTFLGERLKSVKKKKKLQQLSVKISIELMDTLNRHVHNHLGLLITESSSATNSKQEAKATVHCEL